MSSNVFFSLLISNCANYTTKYQYTTYEPNINCDQTQDLSCCVSHCLNNWRHVSHLVTCWIEIFVSRICNYCFPTVKIPTNDYNVVLNKSVRLPGAPKTFYYAYFISCLFQHCIESLVKYAPRPRGRVVLHTADAPGVSCSAVFPGSDANRLFTIQTVCFSSSSPSCLTAFSHTPPDQTRPDREAWTSLSKVAAVLCAAQWGGWTIFSTQRTHKRMR